MTQEERFQELARIPERATAAACFGEPVTSGERTAIPVAQVTYGMGFGYGSGGEGPASDGAQLSGGGGGGGGGGSSARAIAVIEVAPEGVRVLPIQDHTSIALAGITLGGTAIALISRTLIKLFRG
jgi:uncharacterized spore protein YtfJ